MKQTFRLCALVAFLLSLVLIMSGCDTYYEMKDGKLTTCGSASQFTNVTNSCGTHFYRSPDDGKTFTYCTSIFIADCSPVTPSAVASPSSGCTPNWVYDKLVNQGMAWEILTRQESVNSSVSPVQANFSVTTAKTVTVTDEKQFTTSLSAAADLAIVTITVSVKQQINNSVSQSVTITVGNNVTLSVPPGKTEYGKYGVRIQVTSGHLYDRTGCEGSQSDMGTDVTYVPIDAGWCTWLSGQPEPCPSVSG